MSRYERLIPVELTCPVTGCPEVLVLTHRASTPLYRYDPPWTEKVTYGFNDSVSDDWIVECLAGHQVWNSVDQIRATNAMLPEDSNDWASEDTDSAPTFQMDLFLANTPGATYA